MFKIINNIKIITKISILSIIPILTSAIIFCSFIITMETQKKSIDKMINVNVKILLDISQINKNLLKVTQV